MQRAHLTILILGTCFLLSSFANLTAQAEPAVIPLWAKGAPGFENRRNEPEEAQDYWVKNIHNPSITVFRPAKPNGCAVVIAPGGGFRELVYDAEGVQTAAYLNSLGVTAFVLKYRLPGQFLSPYSMEHVKQDAWRAMRTVRSRASEFAIDPKRIGMMGFSAGGAVVTSIAFESGQGKADAADPIDRADGRPDFQILIYPAGEVPRTINRSSPPAFILCASDDEYGLAKTALLLASKFQEAGASVELHLLAQGKHAFNMGDRSSFQSVRTWPSRLGDWLADSGYLKPTR